MNKTLSVKIDKLHESIGGNTVVWAIPEVKDKVSKKLKYPICLFPDYPSAKNDIDTLIVIGGGVLIDTAKIWRVKNELKLNLVAIPSIWGSGAENSSVAILNVDGRKEIYLGEEYLPDMRVIWPELGNNISVELIKNGCGDVWAHSLESFLSPLASDLVRKEASDLIRSLLELSFVFDADWYELSALSSAIQSKSSVGLVHGIAHVIEGKIPVSAGLGHAALCRNLLLPVHTYNVNNTDKVQEYFGSYSIDGDAVIKKLKELFTPRLYNSILPYIVENWGEILVNPLTRTNCTFVRREHISYFLEKFEYE